MDLLVNQLILMEVELRTSASRISILASRSLRRCSTISNSNWGVAGRAFSVEAEVYEGMAREDEKGEEEKEEKEEQKQKGYE